MNHVVRACQDVVRHHGAGNNWKPEGTAGPMAPTHYQLIDQARRDVLNHLHIALSAAEEVAYSIESDRRRRSECRAE